MIKDISSLFKETNSQLVKSVIEGGGVVMGLKVESFAGVLIKEKKFTDGISKKAEGETGIKGFISTDELPKYGINNETKKMIEDSFDCKEKDIVVLVADQKSKTQKALEILEKEIAARKK